MPSQEHDKVEYDSDRELAHAPGAVGVFLIVDQTMICAGYERLLSRRLDLTIVGKSRDPESALEEVAESRPNIVVLDLREPANATVDWLRKIKAVSPATKTVMLRETLVAELVQTALAAGADAVLERESEPSELFLAVDALRRGHTFLSPRLALQLAPRSKELIQDGCDLAAIQALNAYERRLLKKLALGLTTTEIASELNIAPDELLEQQQRLEEMLGCHGSAALTRLAIRTGILPG